MSTPELIDFLDSEAEKSASLAAGVSLIGRDGAEFSERAGKLRECRRKLIAFAELITEVAASQKVGPI